MAATRAATQLRRLIDMSDLHRAAVRRSAKPGRKSRCADASLLSSSGTELVAHEASASISPFRAVHVLPRPPGRGTRCGPSAFGQIMHEMQLRVQIVGASLSCWHWSRLPGCGWVNADRCGIVAFPTDGVRQHFREAQVKIPTASSVPTTASVIASRLPADRSSAGRPPVRAGRRAWPSG